ncbi:MAG: hypothetical protein AAF721_37245 [Myxococcota bacterium]
MSTRSHLPNAARTVAALCLAAGLAGCTKPDPAPPAWQQATTPSERAMAEGPDARDQYALLDAIVAAKGDQLFADPGILARVRGEWIDKRYRWEVRMQPALCGAVGDCVVLPFDHNRRSEPISQGWLPRLSLDATGRTALAERCVGLAQCVITFEGTLTQFELSTELPTSLTFGDVEVTAVREAEPGEAWTVSKRRARLAERASAAVAAAAAR